MICLLQYSILVTVDRLVDFFVVVGYSYKVLLIECIISCVFGDRDIVNRGLVCDRGLVDRVQFVVEGLDLKVMQYLYFLFFEVVFYYLFVLCEFIFLLG